VWSFFETHFEPFAVTNRGEPEGLFTGYYEPTLDGSRVRTERFSVPLYGRPPELLTVDLGRFREEWRGERLAGRLEGAAVVPFADRRAIHRGALAGRRLEVLWVDDPVDAFFLEIQGSGRVRLPDGEEVRVGYAGQNGHPYTAIGRVLVERGALPRQAVSLQSIRRWLEDHPQWARDLLERNASYVFFRILDGDGPRGAQGVVLSPGRSLAVDRRFLPLGAPVWLTTTVPGPAQGTPEEPFRRLLVTQDTGGAIRGPVRGDVFFGPGEEAAWRAGHLKRPGRLWLLLPRGAATAGGS
jgi:membrane-bound lytic murein transglycosylase A